ncbi:MAG: hypothetical protein H0U53_00850 [Actinobacteria bacterium]|nr:hypothetical protein [Actinomycetota bacterium]
MTYSLLILIIFFQVLQIRRYGQAHAALIRSLATIHAFWLKRSQGDV